jgi:hypothetical protein
MTQDPVFRLQPALTNFMAPETEGSSQHVQQITTDPYPELTE